MSKTLQAVIAFLIVFSFTSISYAQEEDYRGITPTYPDEATSSIEENQNVERKARLQELQSNEDTNFRTAKARYIAVLNDPANQTSQENAAITYKLNAILVSARYHKLLSLCYLYLNNIRDSYTEYNKTTSFEITNSDELDLVEQEIVAISDSLNDFDTIVDSFSGTTNAELIELMPELLDKSAGIKSQLEDAQASLLDLVSVIE